MTRFQTLIASLVTVFALPAFAQDHMMVSDAYARVNGAMGASGAIFLQIENPSDVEDQLIDVKSDAAKKVELHTHQASADGVMQMLHVPEGFPVPAMGTLSLERGGHHVMLMGLTKALEDGDMIHLTLVFKNAGEVAIDVPVDNARRPGAMGEGKAMDHSSHMGHAKTAPSN